MIENRRQTAPWERTALAELRAGDPDLAIDAYLDHDRVHAAANDGELRELMVEEWMNVRVDGGDVLMVAPRLADVDDLNQRARTILRDEGYLGDNEVVLDGRGFAVGDEVLALRNDYRIGVLNGTRGAHRPDRPGSASVDDRQSTAANGCRVPFAYAEAGHLTHGYATTIHKAQGATVDRCLVLLDDTSAHEHAYTALSRGRHGNDIYVIDPDRRVDEQHAPEVELDPIDLLRAVTGRSSRRQFALDQTDTVPVGMLDQLRHERDVVQRRMGPGPPDRSREFRDLTRQHQTEQHYLDGARWRKDVAETELDRLGPIGRRTHRHQRRELENRITRFDNEITRHETQLERLDRALETITPDIVDRATWEHDHRDDLDQLAIIDRHIDRAENLERALAQANERSLDHGIDRSLGLEL